jgi:hypothetical protein
MSTSLLIVLSVLEAVVVIIVLALALIEIRRRLTRIAERLETLGSALGTVEAEHLRPLGPAVTAINQGFERIIGLMPGVADKAAIVAAHARKR